MGKVWRIKQSVPPSEIKQSLRSDDLKEQQAGDIITQLLANRGIKSQQEIDNFFNPKIEDYEKELDIPGIDKSLKRIEKAITDQELIVVFGDYDVDGITASAILYKALSSLGARVLPYIPHREKEGYGLSKLGLDFARDSGASLVITVDNGIVALDQAIYAKEIGLDLIITDHHTPGEKKPDAFSIVHTTKICGAAVAFCLIRKIIKKELNDELLELVGIATVADMMPLIGLNRALVFEGLKQLNKTKNLGLLSLFHESRIEKGSLKSYDIGHIIAPRINAIGRLKHAIDALRLLCTKDPVKAKRLAKLLHETNILRQDLTVKAYEEAVFMAQKESSKKIHVLYSKSWHQGIIGLVAGRITEQYGKPSIAFSVGETVSKASARSVEGVNIVEIIRSTGKVVLEVGGHPAAAGFSVNTADLELFKKKIEEKMEKLEYSENGGFLEIEAQVPLSGITKSLVKKLEDFEPFGYGNTQPVLATLNMKISDIRTVGSGKHLKFKVVDPGLGSGTHSIDAIAFNMGELESFLQPGQIVNLAYNLEINKFNGNETLQFKVKDIQFTG